MPNFENNCIQEEMYASKVVNWFRPMDICLRVTSFRPFPTQRVTRRSGNRRGTRQFRGGDLRYAESVSPCPPRVGRQPQSLVSRLNDFQRPARGLAQLRLSSTPRGFHGCRRTRASGCNVESGITWAYDIHPFSSEWATSSSSSSSSCKADEPPMMVSHQRCVKVSGTATCY